LIGFIHVRASITCQYCSKTISAYTNSVSGVSRDPISVEFSLGLKFFRQCDIYAVVIHLLRYWFSKHNQARDRPRLTRKFSFQPFFVYIPSTTEDPSYSLSPIGMRSQLVSTLTKPIHKIPKVHSNVLPFPIQPKATEILRIP